MPDTLTYIATTNNLAAGGGSLICSCNVSYVPDGYTKALITYTDFSNISSISEIEIRHNNVLIDNSKNLNTRTVNVNAGDALSAYCWMRTSSGTGLTITITLSK